MRKLVVSFLVLITVFTTFAQKIERVEPPNWWVGFKNQNLQLLVYGDKISNLTPVIYYDGVKINGVTKVENPNYLFIDLVIAYDTKPGSFDIHFNKGKKLDETYKYELLKREEGSAERIGFNSSDVIYLITPDRFNNGDTSNDEVEGMREGLNRSDKWGRHGGDIRGIINSLDYLQDLGYTAVWLNPILENDMESSSYHGYACTDFYQVDARYGTNEEYLELKDELEERDMKLIMDMIFNHCGSEHWWMKDLPMSDWINHGNEFVPTNHRRTINQDPYASKSDIKGMVDGWFVEAMPDMNQRNKYMARYLIQNSIWWTEYVRLDGIRQDTWPYPDKNMMTVWTKELLEEYPNFNIVGEEWSTNPAIVSYWQKGKLNSDGYQCYSPSMMDFPLQAAAAQGLKNKETWGTGLIQIYEALANDFQYSDANNLTIFPDNHDMSRFFVQVDEDVDLLKMGVAFFLTTRGIPQIYYGTEILMRHDGDQHGDIRADFPGGWEGDVVNAMTGEGLSAEAKDMQKYIAKIQKWRKNATVVHNGKLTHFAPEDGTYVYFRHDEDDCIMVLLNKNEEVKNMNTARFNEVIAGYSKGHDIISGKELKSIKNIELPARSAMIIKLD